jgi:hypothetical protein
MEKISNMDNLNSEMDKLVFCVEKSNSMRLLKKATFNRIKKLKSFEEFSKTNNPLILDKNINIFFLIETKCLFDKDNYFKLFFEKSFLSDESFQQQHDEFLDSMNKKVIKNSKKHPKGFEKLGKMNIFKGCYLVFTKKSDITKITAKNSSNTISFKLNHNNKLPNEFKEMCEEYEKYMLYLSKKEKEEIEQFIKMEQNEQNNLINNIVEGLIKPFVNKQQEASTSQESSSLQNTRAEDSISKKINKISDVGLLNSLMNVAVNEENYELAGNIRDRIKELRKNIN